MGRVWTDELRSPRVDEPRRLVMFDTLDEAQRDARLRGACAVLDAHFRFWSTPTELTLLEIHSQMFRQLSATLPNPPRPADIVVRTPATFGRPPGIAFP